MMFVGSVLAVFCCCNIISRLEAYQPSTLTGTGICQNRKETREAPHKSGEESNLESCSTQSGDSTRTCTIIRCCIHAKKVMENNSVRSKRIITSGTNSNGGSTGSTYIRSSIAWFEQKNFIFTTTASLIMFLSLQALASVPAFANPTEALETTATIGTIKPCVRPLGGTLPANCISTSNVRQVDLYATPWTWSDDTVTSVEEIVGRLKGAIKADSQISIVESNINNDYIKVKATRNFAIDEIEFIINPIDHVITYKCQQIEGPESVSNFGQQRQRLEEIRKRSAVLSIMGSEFDSADSFIAPQSKNSAALQQLKSFWGFQDGTGYEDVLLE